MIYIKLYLPIMKMCFLNARCIQKATGQLNNKISSNIKKIIITKYNITVSKNISIIPQFLKSPSNMLHLNNILFSILILSLTNCSLLLKLENVFEISHNLYLYLFKNIKDTETRFLL